MLADQRVAAYWARQVAAFGAGVARVRERDLAAVHPTRVSVRRMRSTLRTFAELFEPRAIERLDHELEWVAEELGEARDREVLRDLFVARSDLGELRDPLLGLLDHELELQGRRLAAVLRGDRVESLCQHLQRTVDVPAPTETVDLDPFRARARRILAKRLCRAGAEEEPERMHSARKAAKRVRYAAEVVAAEALTADTAAPDLTPEGVFALDEVRRAERLQDGLGHCQDLVVARDYLLRAAGDHPDIPLRPAVSLARTLAAERLAALVAVDRTEVCCGPGVVAVAVPTA